VGESVWKILVPHKRWSGCNSTRPMMMVRKLTLGTNRHLTTNKESDWLSGLPSTYVIPWVHVLTMQQSKEHRSPVLLLLAQPEQHCLGLKTVRRFSIASFFVLCFFFCCCFLNITWDVLFIGAISIKTLIMSALPPPPSPPPCFFYPSPKDRRKLRKSVQFPSSSKSSSKIPYSRGSTALSEKKIT